MGKLQNLQVLRGVAATMVVVYHASIAFADSDFFSSFHRFGPAGVDIFFVISGFIMVVTSQNRAPGAFLLDRLKRIAPLYWLVTAAMLAVSAVGLTNVIYSEADILSSLLFYPWAGANGVMPVLYVGWTLNYEMAFYALFAASLFTGRWQAHCVLAVLVGLVALGVTAATVQGQFYTDPILLEFGLGVLIAKAWLAGVRIPVWLSAALLVVGFVALVAAPRIEEWRVLTWGVPAALIIAGALGLERSRITLRIPGWGDSSYSVYLVHILVIPVLMRVVPFQGAGFVILASVASVLIGWFVWLSVERPIGRLLAQPGFGVSSARRVAPHL